MPRSRARRSRRQSSKRRTYRASETIDGVKVFSLPGRSGSCSLEAIMNVLDPVKLDGGMLQIVADVFGTTSDEYKEPEEVTKIFKNVMNMMDPNSSVEVVAEKLVEPIGPDYGRIEKFIKEGYPFIAQMYRGMHYVAYRSKGGNTQRSTHAFER